MFPWFPPDPTLTAPNQETFGRFEQQKHPFSQHKMAKASENTRGMWRYDSQSGYLILKNDRTWLHFKPQSCERPCFREGKLKLTKLVRIVTLQHPTALLRRQDNCCSAWYNGNAHRKMNREQWTQLFYGDFFIQVAQFLVKTSNHFPHIAATPVTNCCPVAEAKWPAFFTTSLNFSSNSFLVGFVVSTKKNMGFWDGWSSRSQMLTPNWGRLRPSYIPKMAHTLRHQLGAKYLPIKDHQRSSKILKRLSKIPNFHPFPLPPPTYCHHATPWWRSSPPSPPAPPWPEPPAPPPAPPLASRSRPCSCGGRRWHSLWPPTWLGPRRANRPWNPQSHAMLCENVGHLCQRPKEFQGLISWYLVAHPCL